MFADAIERITPFTRPLHSIVRLYGHDQIVPGSATLFFVNEHGCAITCKHVAELITGADALYQNYQRFKGARRAVMNQPDKLQRIKQLEIQYKLQSETIIRIRNYVVGYGERNDIDITLHPTQDLALLRFPTYSRSLYQSYATLLGDSSRVKPGRSLCRLGYPFPEFTNFRYNAQLDDIEWTSEGRISSPRFPIDGIVTRLLHTNGTITGIEMSTPGLKGQSGGPLFDPTGLVFGMQSATNHLHLGFDIEDREVLVNNRKSRVSNYPFLNVGHCIHVDVIKTFLREHNVAFYEG